MKSLVPDNSVVSLQIWDMAGQERKADGVLLLYNLSCEKSFLHVKSWIASIRENEALFIETSAKQGTNVFKAFGRLAR
ncbi:ras and EF-hand domain-containing protein homolog [Diadema setosum]|uniref:ras and EF-hand domain-containing protein homolog n=1 Tax=Diadema setosum TaxID=31175 RepID=UPI003B3BCA07